MKMQTSRFGEIEIQDEQRVVFPEGIIGFEDHKEFALVAQGKDSPFIWLQSLVRGEVAFLLMNPLLVDSSYAADLREDDLKVLQLESAKDAHLYSIVVIPEHNVQAMTANLAAPVVINTPKLLGKQVILQNVNYSANSPVFEGQRKTEQQETEA